MPLSAWKEPLEGTGVEGAEDEFDKYYKYYRISGFAFSFRKLFFRK